MLVLKGNRAALVIQTSAVNFDLLSEEEQENRILTFASLLNSVNYPLQVTIRTKKVDITKYIKYLKDFLNQPMSEGRRKTTEVYLNFIQNLIVKNEILDKKFYVVITYNTTPLASLNPIDNIQKAIQKTMPGGKSAQAIQQQEISNDAVLEQARMNLYPKRDHIIRQLLKMGVTGIQLTTDQLKKLFYDIYN